MPRIDIAISEKMLRDYMLKSNSIKNAADGLLRDLDLLNVIVSAMEKIQLRDAVKLRNKLKREIKVPRDVYENSVKSKAEHRQIEVLKMRDEGQTLSQIADKLGVSKSRAQQIVEKAKRVRSAGTKS